MATPSNQWCRSVMGSSAIALVMALGAGAKNAAAADWSDTAVSWRYGTDFAEPYDNNADGSRKDITKNIFALTHASGYKYGTNFFNVDVLESNGADPGGGIPGDAGAQEIYLVYRNTFDLGKFTGSTYKFGPVRGLGVTGGFDLNSKNDAYGSKKRMLVLGPTLMMDVPGFLNISLLLLDESNAPTGLQSRYTYKTHPELDVVYGIPIGPFFSFNGYFDYIASKGTNEFGGPTSPETHFDGELMYDVGAGMGGAKHTFLIGLEYEYWKNKFGNPTTTPGAGPGATASTPMIRAEYHF